MLPWPNIVPHKQLIFVKEKKSKQKNYSLIMGIELIYLMTTFISIKVAFVDHVTYVYTMKSLLVIIKC